VEAGEGGRLHLPERHLRGSILGPEDALGFTAVSAAFSVIALSELTHLGVPRSHAVVVGEDAVRRMSADGGDGQADAGGGGGGVRRL
jgi:hypothetical protein